MVNAGLMMRLTIRSGRGWLKGTSMIRKSWMLSLISDLVVRGSIVIRGGREGRGVSIVRA
jgi:hypothetical protein